LKCNFDVKIFVRGFEFQFFSGLVVELVLDVLQDSFGDMVGAPLPEQGDDGEEGISTLP
jgi:hypothetical protein